MEPKGNSIELSTFLKYGLTKVIGHKTVEAGGKTLVNYVWCKVCAKFKTQIESYRTSKVVQKQHKRLSMVQTLSQNIRYEFILLFIDV